jgi:23S rRNA (guanosine2251-2'-O)-methyltransferase
VGRDHIEGRNPVREALRAGRSIRRVLISEASAPRGPLAEIIDAARAAGVRVERVPREVLDRMASSRAHQGVIAEAEAFRFRSWRDALSLAAARSEAPLLLALDGITDPGNLGSLLRSAEAAGCHGVLIPARRATDVTPVVEKASAGALEHLILDKVPNLTSALKDIKREGLWIVGLDGEAEGTLWDCDLLAEPLALVVGAEGRGIGRLVSETADVLVRIPIYGRVQSLNAAVAGAIALFATSRRRHA